MLVDASPIHINKLITSHHKLPHRLPHAEAVDQQPGLLDAGGQGNASRCRTRRGRSRPRSARGSGPSRHDEREVGRVLAVDVAELLVRPDAQRVDHALARRELRRGPVAIGAAHRALQTPRGLRSEFHPNANFNIC